MTVTGESTSHWICHHCNDGPKNVFIELSCVICGHSRCSYCFQYGKTEPLTAQGWSPEAFKDHTLVPATALAQFDAVCDDGGQITINKGDAIEVFVGDTEPKNGGWYTARIKGSTKLTLMPLANLNLEGFSRPSHHAEHSLAKKASADRIRVVTPRLVNDENVPKVPLSVNAQRLKAPTSAGGYASGDIYDFGDENIFDSESEDETIYSEDTLEVPLELRASLGHNASFLESDPLTMLDKIKNAFVSYSGQVWDWWPLDPPRTPLAPDKTRVKWRCVSNPLHMSIRNLLRCRFVVVYPGSMSLKKS